MKRLYYIATLAIALFASLPIQAQEEAGNTQQQQQRRRGPEASRGAREEEKKENGMPELTVRAQDMNERMTQHIGNARWMRVIYRQIDLYSILVIIALITFVTNFWSVTYYSLKNFTVITMS